MRLTIDQSDLQSALSIVSRAIKGHPTLPTLGGVLLKSAGNRVTLVGTDMDLTIEATVPANVEEDGAVVLPGKPLLEITKKLPGGDVSVSVNESHAATITCGRSRVTLLGIAPRTFPKVPEADGEAVKFDPDILRVVLSRVTFAVSTDETRPILTGVCIDLDGNQLRAVATDGYRVAAYADKVQWTVSSDPVRGLVIPGRALRELERMLDTDAECRLSIGQGHANFDLGDVRLTCRLIDGQYPDVLSLVPSEYPHKFRVSRQELLEALQRAALVAQGQQTGKHVVRLDIAEDRITISARDPELGEAREEVPAQLAGDGMAIGFNARYLIDGLKVIGSEEVEIGLTGPLQAAQVRGVDEDGFRYVVLPVKLGDREGVPF